MNELGVIVFCLSLVSVACFVLLFALVAKAARINFDLNKAAIKMQSSIDRICEEVSCIKQDYCAHDHKLVSESDGFVNVTCKRCKKLLAACDSYEEVESYLDGLDEKPG